MEVPSTSANTVKCKCFFDQRTVNPDFTAMAATVSNSFVSTLTVGVNHLFSVSAVSENPTIFYTLGTMTLLAVLLLYRGYQLDLKDKDAEGKRIFLEYNMKEIETKRQQSRDDRDKKKKLEAIAELKASNNENQRMRGMLMERDKKKEEHAMSVLVKMGGGSSVEAQEFVDREDSAKKNWNAIKKIGLAQHLKKSVHKHLEGGDEAGNIFGAMMGEGRGMRCVALAPTLFIKDIQN